MTYFQFRDYMMPVKKLLEIKDGKRKYTNKNRLELYKKGI